MSMKKEIAIYALIIIVGLMAAQHMNVVVSGSMEPVLYRGDIVIIEKTNFLGTNEFNPNDAKVGDIVVYDAKWYPNPVIHRIINETYINGTKYFIIKGDNNDAQDPYPVSPSQIRERVSTIGDQPLIIPKIGYITLWLRGLWFSLKLISYISSYFTIFLYFYFFIWILLIYLISIPIIYNK